MKSKKYIFIFLLFAFVLAGCSRLSEKKTIALLQDFYLYENLPNALDISSKDSVSLMLSLFEKHRVSQEQFEATIRYYAAHPKKMKALYEKLKLHLQEHIGYYETILEEKEWAQNRLKDTSKIVMDSVQLPRTKFFYLPVEAPGNYTLKTVVTLFENDATQQPGMCGYFLANSDSLPHDTINRKTALFTKSTNAQTYTLSFSVQDSAIYAFEGYWLHVKPDTAPVSQHITMEKRRILYNNDSTKTIAADLEAAKKKAMEKKNPTEQNSN